MNATAIIDRISSAELMDRYSLNSRTAIANRLKALGITEERDRGKLYVPVEALERLDLLNECLKQPGAKLSECAAQINTIPSFPTPDSRPPIPDPRFPTPDSPFVQLVRDIAAALRPEKDPLAPLVSLETAVDNGWLLTTQQVRALIGVYPKGETYTRGSFSFIRSGKIGNQTAWRVERSTLITGYQH